MTERQVFKLSDINRITRVSPGASGSTPVATPGSPRPPNSPSHNPVWEAHVNGPRGSHFGVANGCIFIYFVSSTPVGGGEREFYFRYALQAHDPMKSLRQPSELVAPDLAEWLSNLTQPTFLRIEFKWAKTSGRSKKKYWYDVTPCEEWAAKSAARKQRNEFDNEQADQRQERRVK